MGTRPRLQLEGQRFGKLIVESVSTKDRNGHYRFLCRCDCGVEKVVQGTHLVQGKTISCGCAKPRGSSHKQWTGCGEIHGNYFAGIRRSAAGSKGRAPLTFDITIEYIWDLFLAQERRCALSGLELNFKVGNYNSPGRGHSQTASLDRIDSGEGYVPGNVQWVHKDINRMKSVLPQDRFLDLCRRVSAHNSSGSSGSCEL